MANTVRPTKKQRELLNFIEQFIGEHGYSPSYREIMTGLNYTSVATVALHINNLIKRGHLRKRDHSARSLEVVSGAGAQPAKTTPSEVTPSEEKWLIDKVESLFANAETADEVSQDEVDQLYVLIGALKVLELDGAAQSFMPRLASLRQKVTKEE